MKKLTKALAMIVLFALLCSLFSGCGAEKAPADTTDDTNATTTAHEDTDSKDTEPEETEPAPLDPIDIKTTGGVVVVGTVCHDDEGWYLTPEQPLNVEYEYFLDAPSTFDKLTRIYLFDSSIDNIDKVQYLDKTVTIEGTFRFYRDDFEKLYLLPYVIQFGKTVAESYGDSDLQAPDLTESRYDPSIPLPGDMAPKTSGGKYVYNPSMLSRESLDLMGNDFAAFYCDFVDAFLNYKSECPCPDKEFAKMLSTIIFYELPLYDYCAEPFEFVKHYDAEKEAVKIIYNSDSKADHQKKLDDFMDAANELLATTSTSQSEGELAKNIYHELCIRMTYDDSAMIEIQRKNAYYAYMEKSGVCVTFANVYNQLLTQVGIEATTAQCDYTETVGHVWSLVTIDGAKYFCDPTFELSFKDGTAYAYFCMTYDQRVADGLGADGITVGRYYPYAVYAGLISDTPFDF